MDLYDLLLRDAKEGLVIVLRRSSFMGFVDVSLCRRNERMNVPWRKCVFVYIYLVGIYTHVDACVHSSLCLRACARSRVRVCVCVYGRHKSLYGESVVRCWICHDKNKHKYEPKVSWSRFPSHGCVCSKPVNVLPLIIFPSLWRRGSRLSQQRWEIRMLLMRGIRLRLGSSSLHW